MNEMRRLLVVDDEPDMLDFVERTFRLDYRVDRARSVAEALPLLEGGALDVLITDERMPRRGGGELLARARALQPRAVCVLLSGFAEAGGGPGPADLYLIKPIDADELRHAVAEALARHAAR